MKTLATITVAVLMLALPALAGTTTVYTLASNASGAPGYPNANLYFTDGSHEYYSTYYGYGNPVTITFYNLGFWVGDLHYTQTLISGPGTCTTATKLGTNMWHLEIPETATENSLGQPVTVSVSYTLTNYYSSGGGGRGGGGAGCHFVFLAGGTTTLTID